MGRTELKEIHDHPGFPAFLRDLVTDATGDQRPELCEADDPIHGNLAFGRLILADLLERGL